MPPRVGPYLLDRKLGSGGMGTVYLGIHEGTGEKAAVKVLPAALAREEGFRERFGREVEAVKALRSPHIAGHLASGACGPDGDLWDPDAPGFDADAAVAFLAMQYIPGETLLVRLRRDRRLPWRAAVELGIQTCAALKAAHDAGVVHRDLKPSNLILADGGGDPGNASDGVGRVVLVDFGVAQLFAAGRLTKTGGVIGTAEFMAPEQASGTRVTKKSDLYSLGALLYACVCGVPPFRGTTAADVLQRHRFGTFDAPRRYAPDCPPAVEAVIRDLLAKNPADRPADARVVAERLKRAVAREDYLTRAGDAGRREPGGRAGGRTAGLTAGRPDDGDLSERPTRAATDAGPGGGPSGPDGFDAAPLVLVDDGGDPAGDRPTAAASAPGRGPGAAGPDGGERFVFPKEGPGPATTVRNAVVRELSRLDEPGPAGRLFDSVWVQLAALALLAGGGVWWFSSAETRLPPAEMTVGQHLAAARGALEGPPGAAWVRARDRHLAPLLADGGPDRITARAAEAGNVAAFPLSEPARASVREEAADLADRVRRHEIETDARRPAFADPPATEAERLLRLAARRAQLGDRPAAARTLRAFLAATAGQRRVGRFRRIAAAMLADLSDAAPDGRPGPPPPLAVDALANAAAALAAGRPGEAAAILDGLEALYAGDPAAEEVLASAAALRTRLAGEPPRTEPPRTETPRTETPRTEPPRTETPAAGDGAATGDTAAAGE